MRNFLSLCIFSINFLLSGLLSAQNDSTKIPRKSPFNQPSPPKPQPIPSRTLPNTYSFPLEQNQPTSYEVIIDNPDTNHATFYLNLNILNGYLEFGSESNIGLFPGIQAFYTEKNKNYGFEISYGGSITTTSISSAYLRHSFLEAGGFYALKTKYKKINQHLRLYTYQNYNTKTHVVLDAPKTQKVTYGIRGGILNENLLDNYEAYSTWGVFIGFNKNFLSNFYAKTTNGSTSKTHDHSYWIIGNYDLIYSPIITPDIRERIPDNSLTFPLGIRISRQLMFPVSRKEQREKAHGIFFKLAGGYKTLQGVFFNISVGWQAIRY